MIRDSGAKLPIFSLGRQIEALYRERGKVFAPLKKAGFIPHGRKQNYDAVWDAQGAECVAAVMTTRER